MFVGNLIPLLIITGTCGIASGAIFLILFGICPKPDALVSIMPQFALGVGYGMGTNPASLNFASQSVTLIFGGPGIVPAAMVAILLKILLPKKKEETKENA